MFSVFLLLPIKYNFCLRDMSFIEAFARLRIYFATCCCKLAKLVIFELPIFKAGRPVAILPYITKCLKRIAYNRILSYLNDSL